MRKLRRTFTSLPRILRWALIALALPFVLIPLYAVVPPPVTTVMVWKLFGGAGIHKDWEPIERISPHLVRAVLVAEDGRFCQHWGIDWKAVQDAASERRKNPRGASTISMQLVKNLFLWTGRDWFRKTVEAPLALYADLVLSKRRSMEIYLNVVEWGKGIYGAEAAARHYFGVSARQLNPRQAALLAGILPSPRNRSPQRPGAYLQQRAGVIAARAANSGAYAGCVLGR